MINARRLHRFLGVFFTPTILFFAFSGALQTFGLHESPRRGEPPPVAWIADIASIHKEQKLRSKDSHEHGATPAGEAATAPRSAPPPSASQAAGPAQEESWQPLKLFVLLMAIGLSLSSLIGVYLALSNPRARGEAGMALALGAILPLLLLLL